ncbi:MAG: hypothetical protein NXI04_29390 [Planctomycetaceae bacterium]|nr:hypothetical protein [Planctomycetaceae bacterium]
MTSEQGNPFQAPTAVTLTPPAERLNRGVWRRWLLGTMAVETGLTVGTVFLDSKSIIGDSGEATFKLNGLLWLIATIVMARRHLPRQAIVLSLMVGLAGWLAMIVVAHFAVPTLLGGSIGHRVYLYLMLSWGGGAVLVPLVVLLVPKPQHQPASGA